MEGAVRALSLDRLVRPYSRRMVYRQGEYVYLPGDPSDAVYLIIKGRVKLSSPGRDGRPLPLSILGEGEIFGEMALVGAERRELMAEVLERSSIWAIEKESFLRLLQGNATLSLQIMEVFIHRLKLLQERVMELLFQDPLAKLSLLLSQTMQEGEEPDLLRLIRVAMTEGVIATPLSSS